MSSATRRYTSGPSKMLSASLKAPVEKWLSDSKSGEASGDEKDFDLDDLKV